MLSKAGQTAVPNWLPLFEGTHVGALGDGGNIKNIIFFSKHDFFIPRATPNISSSYIF